MTQAVPAPLLAEDRMRSRWDIVVIALIAGFVAGMQIGKVPPAIPLLRDELGISMITAGWIASFFTFVGALLGAVIGVTADRLGTRHAVVLSLGACAAGSFLGGVADSTILLMTSRALESLGFIGTAVSAPRLILSAIRPQDRNVSLGLWSTYVPGGMAIIMLSAPFIIPDFGWRGLWMTSGGLALLIMLLLIFMTAPGRFQPNHMPVNPIAPLTALKLLAAKPGPWLLALSFMLYSVQFLAFMSWLPTFLIESLAYPVATAATIGALVVAANMIGNVAAGLLLARGWGTSLLLALAFIGMAVTAFLSFYAATPEVLRLFCAFAFSAVGGLIPGTLLAATPVYAPRPDLVGSTNGMVMQGSNIGSLSGPPLMAFAVSMTGSWEGGSVQNIVCGALGILVAILLARAARRRPVPAMAD